LFPPKNDNNFSVIDFSLGTEGVFRFFKIEIVEGIVLAVSSGTGLGFGAALGFLGTDLGMDDVLLLRGALVVFLGTDLALGFAAGFFGTDLLFGFAFGFSLTFIALVRYLSGFRGSLILLPSLK
jgi:hypothetical protein